MKLQDNDNGLKIQGDQEVSHSPEETLPLTCWSSNRIYVACPAQLLVNDDGGVLSNGHAIECQG